MKVTELTSKIGDMGTKPRVYIQECGTILGGGTPEEIGEKYGGRRVNTFIVPSTGNINIFIEA